MPHRVDRRKLACLPARRGARTRQERARTTTLAATHGHPAARISVLPTAVLVSLGDGRPPGLRTVDSFRALRLDQASEAIRLARSAEQGRIPAADALAELRGILRGRPRFGTPVRVLAHGLMTVGLGLVIHPTAVDLWAYAALGVLVGALKAWAARFATGGYLLAIVCAGAVSAIAFLAHGSDEAASLRLTIPPLVTFLPGALLTMATVDLAMGETALLRKHGHSQVDFTVVGSGPNGASPHHEMGERIIEEGDMVVLDFGGIKDGYGSDTTRTVHVGPPTDEEREVFEIVRRAQQAGFEAVRPGVACQEVDRAARKVIADAGYGEYFIHRVGHGIGTTTHEPPYMIEGEEHPIEPGMCFSIEPGIYLPGRFGVRIEDIVVATEDGGVRLNNTDRRMRIVS